MKSIYVDSLQFHSNVNELGYFAQSPIQGLDFPDIRLSNYEKSGEHGAIVSNQLYGGRLITIQGMVYATGASDFEARRRNIESYFRVVKDSAGKPIPKTLKFTTLDDLALQVEVFTQRFKLDRTEVSSGVFILSLYAPNFELLGQSAKNSNIAVPSGGGATYPVVYPVVYGAEEGGQANVVNNGTVETWPTIALNGPLNNPIITNVTTGRFLQLGLTVSATDQVVIDMRNKTIVLNGSTNVISNLSSGSRFWWLEPGTNNITFRTSSSSDTGTCQVQYRDAYVGV